MSKIQVKKLKWTKQINGNPIIKGLPITITEINKNPIVEYQIEQSLDNGLYRIFFYGAYVEKVGHHYKIGSLDTAKLMAQSHFDAIILSLIRKSK